jgi:hypothetical protein
MYSPTGEDKAIITWVSPGRRSTTPLFVKAP